MNDLSEHLTDPVLRSRLMDLSFSLYDGLHDFLGDMVVLDGGYADDDDVKDSLSRLNTAAMDCLGDIQLIVPILTSIRNSLSKSGSCT